MKVLVTGASGMLGQDLCPILEDGGYEVIEVNSSDMDITDIKAVESVISDCEPDIVIHCAAYTNVDKAEEDSEKAFLINGVGTENIAKVVFKLNIPIIYISTDYVFDGTKNSPYLPSDKTNPINIYGASKLKGEEAVKKHCLKYYIVRTSWLYGHHGKNFVETMLSLANDCEEIKVVNDQTGCPTWTVALCDGIIDLIEEEAEYGIYHVCGSGKATWYEFANEIFKISGIKKRVLPVTSLEFPRPAKRPPYSVMDNDDICPDWKVSLNEYINLRCDD